VDGAPPWVEGPGCVAWAAGGEGRGRGRVDGGAGEGVVWAEPGSDDTTGLPTTRPCACGEGNPTTAPGGGRGGVLAPVPAAPELQEGGEAVEVEAEAAVEDTATVTGGCASSARQGCRVAAVAGTAGGGAGRPSEAGGRALETAGAGEVEDEVEGPAAREAAETITRPAGTGGGGGLADSMGATTRLSGDLTAGMKECRAGVGRGAGASTEAAAGVAAGAWPAEETGVFEVDAGAAAAAAAVAASGVGAEGLEPGPTGVGGDAGSDTVTAVQGPVLEPVEVVDTAPGARDSPEEDPDPVDADSRSPGPLAVRGGDTGDDDGEIMSTGESGDGVPGPRPGTVATAGTPAPRAPRGVGLVLGPGLTLAPPSEREGRLIDARLSSVEGGDDGNWTRSCPGREG
jgi:hypothetical protein